MINLDNYKFHYSLIGSTNQPVILLLHGFMGDSDDFYAVISMLSEKFCCLAVDLPGHGKTRIVENNECYIMSNTAEALIHLLDRLKIDKCLLFGYSMGGRLALYMTVHFPTRFEKAILESASPGLKTEEARSQRRQADSQLAHKLETSNFNTFLLNWYNQPLFQSLQTHPNFEQLIQRRLQNNPFELAKSLRYMGTGNQPSLWKKLPQNQVPLLLLVGEKDDKFRAINADMAKLCPVAQLQIIPEAGHNIHLENIAEWLKNVVEFCL